MGIYRTGSIIFASAILGLGALNFILTVSSVGSLWLFIFLCFPIIIGAGGLYGILKENKTIQTVYKYGLIVLGVLSVLYAILYLLDADFSGVLIELACAGFSAAAWFVLNKYHDEEHQSGHKEPLV